MNLTVQPLRFTDNIDEMARLLTSLGLSVSITSDKGGWVVLSGQAGTVALHSAAGATSGATQGQTTLSFETSDVEELVRRLTAAGFGTDTDAEESLVYDEAYGRALTIGLGEQRLIINETSDDLYGYSSTGVTPGVGDLRVTPIRFVDDNAADRRLLESLGFALVGASSDDFTLLALPGVGGSVGLHRADWNESRVIPGPFAVQLSFETTTPLPEIIQRAESVGAAAKLTESEFGDHVTITDPDGQQIQVHATSA